MPTPCLVWTLFMFACWSLPAICSRVCCKRQELHTLREHLNSPRCFGGVRATHLFTFLCCPIMWLYVPSSVFWCTWRFPHKNDVRFDFTSSCLKEGARLIYVICVCLRIVVSNIYCVVFYFCFSSSCVSHVGCFSGLSILISPSVFSNDYSNKLRHSGRSSNSIGVYVSHANHYRQLHFLNWFYRR